MKKTEELDCRKSSRKLWPTLRKFGNARTKRQKTNSSVSANLVASKLKINSQAHLDKSRLNKVERELKKKMKASSTDTQFSRSFSITELDIAVKEMKVGKAAGPDGVFMEFIKSFGLKTKTWLLDMFNDIFFKQKLPKLFKRSKVLAVCKPGKDGTDVTHYRPISLMCIIYKLLKLYKLMLDRLQPHLDQFIPKKQAGFR